MHACGERRKQVKSYSNSRQPGKFLCCPGVDAFLLCELGHAPEPQGGWVQACACTYSTALCPAQIRAPCPILLLNGIYSTQVKAPSAWTHSETLTGGSLNVKGTSFRLAMAILFLSPVGLRNSHMSRAFHLEYQWPYCFLPQWA